MKQYTLKLITTCIAFFLIFSSCDEDILDRLPLDQVNDQAFWKTKNDLELYATKFYTNLPGWGNFNLGAYQDINTDNFYQIRTQNDILKGVRTIPASGGGWNFSKIRDVNYFLENYQRAGLPESETNHLVGTVYFFRAYFYYDMVKKFGDVQWFDKTLNVDSEELYKPRDPRNYVIDRIIEDLDKAIAKLDSGKKSGGNELNREIALLFKSRICLYEGTWEKYHSGTAFKGNGNVNHYLNLAANAAKEVMDSKFYSIYDTDDTSDYGDYAHLFNQNDYSDNPEVMLWKKYDADLWNNAQRFSNMWAARNAVDASLVDSYLCTDGQPISVSPLFLGFELDKVHINRDARLGQLIYFPGDLWQYNSSGLERKYEYPNLLGTRNWQCIGMYRMQKVANPDLDLLVASNFNSSTGYTIFRYAEVLLNYAEAKAELGELNQDDIDITINKLRDRAGMPPLNKGNITSDPNWAFPALSPLMNEIRRERRVELACEGYRFDDLMRWRAHHLFVAKRPKGGLFIDYYNGKSNIPVDENGNIDFFQTTLPNGYEFDINRDYLAPIPENQITLTDGAIEQNPGWGN